MSTDNPYASPTMPASASREVPPLEPPQSVSFKLTRADVLNASELATEAIIPSLDNASPRFLPASFNRRVSLLFAILSVMAALRYSVLSGEFVLLALGTVLFFFADRLFIRLMGAISRQLTAKRLDSEEFDEARLAKACLMQEGFEFLGPDGPALREWPSIDRVVSDEQSLLIILDSATIQVIPAHAFADNVAFQSYCQLAKRLWHEAHGNDTTSG